MAPFTRMLRLCFAQVATVLAILALLLVTVQAQIHPAHGDCLGPVEASSATGGTCQDHDPADPTMPDCDDCHCQSAAFSVATDAMIPLKLMAVGSTAPEGPWTIPDGIAFPPEPPPIPGC